MAFLSEEAYCASSALTAAWTPPTVGYVGMFIPTQFKTSVKPDEPQLSQHKALHVGHAQDISHGRRQEVQAPPVPRGRADMFAVNA